MSPKFPSVFITGANRGIGLNLLKAIRSSLKPEIIFATYRDPSNSKELQDIAAANKDVHLIQLDVQDYDKHESLVKEVASVSPHGISLLINNAGVSSKFTKIEQLSADEIRNVMEVNLVAPLMLTKALLPVLARAAEVNYSIPAIVNISSVMGSIQANDVGGFYPYRCSKAALNAATKSMSIDLKHSRIISIAVHPGWVKTNMGGPRAPLSPEDSAQGIVGVLQQLDQSHNGKFLQYDGQELPW